MNSVKLLGNLTRDPELTFTQGGLAIAKMGIAINRKWKDSNGQPKEETTFVDIEGFGKQAEVFAQYHKKGQKALIEGRLKLDQWQDKASGQKKHRMIVVMEEFHFVGAPERNQDSQPNRQAQRPVQQRPAPAPATQPQEDDVPY